MAEPPPFPDLPTFVDFAGQAGVVLGAGGVMWWLLRVHYASTATYEMLKDGLEEEVERLTTASGNHADEVREITDENRELRAENRQLRSERDKAEREVARLKRALEAASE